MNADLVQLDDYNPLDIGDSISQAANNEQMRRERHRRVSSTFSTYYLNTRAKDLASLASLQDLGRERDLYQSSLTNGGKILEQDQSVTKQQRDHTGTSTIRDLVSFKTEVRSLIGNLHDKTLDQNMLMNNLRGRLYKNPRDPKTLLTRVLQLLKRHNVDPQKLNGIRFECKRQMQNWRNNIVSHFIFMNVLRQYQLYMTLDDQKDFIDFISLGATKNHFNLDNLNKLFDILSKISYKSQ